MKKFEGKIVIITGAGAGIGRASALMFAREGANVVAVDKNENSVRETVELIKQRKGTSIAKICDVADKNQVVELITDTAERFGNIDVMFNNAGVPMKLTKTEDVTENMIDQIIDVNLKGVFWGIQAVLPYMKKQSSGVIINTASINGVRPRVNNSIYSAIKAGVIILTKSIALEVAEFGVRVVAINPVATDTDMLKSAVEERDYDSGLGGFVSSIPLGRLATPEEVAQIAVFLASDETYMITGSSIDVDGGRGI